MPYLFDDKIIAKHIIGYTKKVSLNSAFEGKV